MARLNARRLIWACERAYLRHGAIVPMAAIGFLALVVLLADICWSYRRIAQTEEEIGRRAQQLRAAIRPDMPREKVQVLPMPAMSRRFGINQRVLATLQGAGFEPERMRFKFEEIQDADLTRQVASFTLTGRWGEVAKALSALQAADRALYISRLRLSRQTLVDDQVSAEVQLAVAFVANSQDGGGP